MKSITIITSPVSAVSYTNGDTVKVFLQETFDKIPKSKNLPYEAVNALLADVGITELQGLVCNMVFPKLPLRGIEIDFVKYCNDLGLTTVTVTTVSVYDLMAVAVVNYINKNYSTAFLMDDPFLYTLVISDQGANSQYFGLYKSGIAIPITQPESILRVTGIDNSIQFICTEAIKYTKSASLEQFFSFALFADTMLSNGEKARLIAAAKQKAATLVQNFISLDLNVAVSKYAMDLQHRYLLAEFNMLFEEAVQASTPYEKVVALSVYTQTVVIEVMQAIIRRYNITKIAVCGDVFMGPLVQQFLSEHPTISNAIIYPAPNTAAVLMGGMLPNATKLPLSDYAPWDLSTNANMHLASSMLDMSNNPEIAVEEHICNLLREKRIVVIHDEKIDTSLCAENYPAYILALPEQAITNQLMFDLKLKPGLTKPALLLAEEQAVIIKRDKLVYDTNTKWRQIPNDSKDLNRKYSGVLCITNTGFDLAQVKITEDAFLITILAKLGQGLAYMPLNMAGVYPRTLQETILVFEEMYERAQQTDQKPYLILLNY